MTKKKSDLVEALREMAQGRDSARPMSDDDLRGDDLAGDDDDDRRNAFEAMAELTGSYGQGTGSISDLFDDFGSDDI